MKQLSNLFAFGCVRHFFGSHVLVAFKDKVELYVRGHVVKITLQIPYIFKYSQQSTPTIDRLRNLA